MQEAKQEFPGNTLSGGVFKLSAFTFAFLLFVSATDFSQGLSFFGIDGTYFHLVGLAIVATLSYQHKAVFTKKEGEVKSIFETIYTLFRICKEGD